MKLSRCNVELLLAEKQLSKNEFSEISGIPYTSFCSALTRGNCSPKTAGRIAHGLNVPVADILENEV